jgi:hypothetical protein
MRWRFWPEPSWWRLSAACCFCALLWLVMPQIARGQELKPPPTSGSSGQIESLIALSTMQMQRLLERQQQVQKLQDALTRASEEARGSSDDLKVSRVESMLLRQELASARELQAQSQTELQVTLKSLAESKTAFSSLRQASATYRQEAQDQIAEIARERNMEKARADAAVGWAIAGWISAAIAAGLAGAHLLGAW